MKNKKIRITLSALTLCSLWLMTISAYAAPIRFSQVVQIVTAKSGKANTGNFSQLRLAGDDALKGDDDDDTKKTAAPPQDGRVIVETRSDIVEDDTCDCLQPPVGGGFPKYALLGLAAIPLFFLIHHHDDTPTPTPPTTPPMTPTDTPTPTPTNTPTPTPTMTPTPSMTPTPTPPMTPTPVPTPEPVTILLFGTGLAGVGFAARKRLRRRKNSADEI